MSALNEMGAQAQVASEGCEGAGRCSFCRIKLICIGGNADEASMRKLDTVVGMHRTVKKRELLFRVNDPLSKLYVVRQGQFKMHMEMATGDEQIVGFQMAGDVLGWDAIANDQHVYAATALEDSEVCEIPFASLQEVIGSTPVLLNRFHRLMSEEIARDQRLMLLLSTMTAEQRMAVFLLNLASSYGARGYSASQFRLSMSREDIGTYLGLTLESISRLFSGFKKRGVLDINYRTLRLLDPARLKAMANGN